MDVVLEIFDTFIFDRIYANVLAIRSSVSSFDPVSTIAASLKSYDVLNASWSGAASSIGDGGYARSGWQYQPATQSLGFQPSEFAYMSRWDRDNVWRQGTSLYIITA